MTNPSRTWQPILPPAGPQPVGAYSPATAVGNLIFTSGQVPLNPESGVTERDAPFAAQARLALANLARVLEGSGSSLANVVSVTVYLQDIEDWQAFNTIYTETFDPPFPARTAVGATLAGFRVEVSAVAVREPEPA